MTETLEDLEVLVVDCQTTGSTPERGHLLEVAWSRGRPGRFGAVVSHLVRLPRGKRIPPRIRKLTGIGPDEMGAALPAAEVEARLRAAAPPTAVAHFARFERAFLEALESEWVCTHEIACRLLPGLPRRGLRAVSGYLGHVMPEGKRAAAHVRATAAVWSALVARLREQGIATLPGLRAWMEAVAPARRGGRDVPLPRDARLALPESPGVYRLRGKGGELLYVGKATSLKRRVNSHFQHRRATDRSKEMLTQIYSVDIAVLGSPLEAALREADEIKRHAPPYNVALRNRQVWFASRDFSSVRDKPDAVHRLGPLPHADALAAVPSIRALQLPEGSDLEPELLEEGFAMFRERRGRASYRELGARLWRIRKAELEAERERKEGKGEGPGEEERDEERRGWKPATPEDVVALLEQSVRRGARLLRRARWMAGLSESSLQWRPGGRPRVLVVTRGAVAECRDGTEAPAPRRRSHLQRLRCFDAATYDRLRVLTTELRRVVAEGGPIELRLGGRAPLGREALARRLERF